MRQSIKRLFISIYAIIIIVMAVATFLEYSKGTQFAYAYIYGSWWFCSLWAVLVIVSVTYIIKSRLYDIPVMLIHLSFVIILLGALTTHLFAVKGIVHLRQGVTMRQYITNGDKDHVKKLLPFDIRLDSFNVIYYVGTSSARDYVSNITVSKDNETENGKISMNKIFSYHSVRFYQNSYDEDGKGSYLAINSDPYGIAISYTGYALLFLSLIGLLVNPKGTYRRLLRSPLLKKGILMIVLLFTLVPKVECAPTFPDVSARKFGRLDIMYNNRICPLQTFSIDFTKKLCGSACYREYSAEQVLAGFIFWNDDWGNEPVINVTSEELRNSIGLPEYVSLHQLFNHDIGGYILGPLVQEYYQGNQDKLHKAVMEIDDKVQLIMSLRNGEQMKMFPYAVNGNIRWYGPKEATPASMDHRQALFISSIFTFLNQSAHVNNYKLFNMLIAKLRIYQERNGGSSLPSVTSVKAELIYNKIPFTTVLFMINLTMGFVTLLYAIYRLIRKHSQVSKSDRVTSVISLAILGLSFSGLTYCEILRWIISGTIPMANGYETMLLLAWLVMLFSLIAYHRFHILLTFGFLLSGFFLLVSHIGQMDPQITPVMPVLSSPLLSIHVSIIMISFALLSLTFICGLVSLILYGIHQVFCSDKSRMEAQLSSLHLLSQLFLYPAIATLGIGIFIGAIWANVSWGQYWSWDPKEVWALITFMFYAVALHTNSFPVFRTPLYYHLYIIMAFCMILMTYFGVNYFLGGMHSYA